MPSSRPNIIPVVINLLRQLQPDSILDVGVGFGKWGHLFREYTDILEAERDPERYRRENWRVQIDGIEGFPAYITDMHRFLYNKIYTGDALEVIKKLGTYDLVFMGDVIEHLEKEAGMELLRQAIAHSHKAVIVSTPKYDTNQGSLCGNELERHRSVWREKDFHLFNVATVKTIDRATLLAAIVMPGIAPPSFTPPMPPKAADARRMRMAVDYLTQLIPVEQPFILVDEEQIRSELPHRNALPFLENQGEYWGPPEDDGTAIAEFERMRESGVAFIGFIWSCFWWLEYYPAFYQHLRDRFSCAVENEEIVIFDLRR